MGPLGRGDVVDRSTGRSAGLDALRAVACGLVVLFHLHTVAGVPFGPLDASIAGGDQGVYIFFALSGYLLYRPFIDRRGGRGVDLRAYAIKRAARILPGYYVALVGLTLLTGSPLPGSAPVPYLLIAAGYSLPLRAFLGSAWTLSAEVLFYATLPLIAAAARGRELRVLSALAAASIGWTLFLRVTTSDAGLIQLAFFPAVFYAFVPGMLLAAIELRQPAAFARLAAAPYALGGAVLIGAGTVLHALPIALGVGLGTPLLMGWLLQHHVPGARPLAFLGGASYAMYLWHKDALLTFGILGLPIALAAAALSWAVVERPILDWAHGVAKRLGGPTSRATPPDPRAAAGVAPPA